MSLRYRIAATIFVLEAVMMGLVLWRTLDLAQAGYREQMEATETLLLRLVAEHCRSDLVTLESAELQSYLGQIQDPRIRLVLLADHRNRVIAASEPRFVGSDLPPLDPQGEEHWRLEEIRNAAGPLGTLAIRFSDRAAYESSNRILKNALLIAGFGMTLIAGVALVMGHLLTRRLVALGRAVRRLERGDLSVRADLQGGDEVTQVGKAFDEMARSLHENVNAMREKEAQMRLLTDALPVGISYVDRDLRVQFVNLQLSKWLGWNREAMIGKPFFECLGAEQREAVEGGLQSASRGNIVHHERPFETQDRQATMDVVHVPHIGSDGSVRGIYSLLRDISHAKARDAERDRLMSELSNKNAELEQLAYTVSHDLKSPLITILGSAEYLEEELGATPSSVGREDLSRIHHAAETMTQMLDELLDLARIGVVENQQDPIRLRDLVDDTVRLLAGRIGSRRAEVTISESMPTVLGDRRRLQRVVQNLLDNAVKFTPKNERPEIEIGAQVHEQAPTEALCWVRDHGAGIPVDQLDKIFEVFRQVDRKKEGTGIGLAIAQRIVDGHGGRIWVESEGAERGSTFFFTLPLADPRAADLRPA